MTFIADNLYPGLESSDTDEILARISEAEAIIEDCRAELGRRRAAEIIKLKEEWSSKAAALGVTIEVLDPLKKQRAKGIVKYRNPSDQTQTWTGRGKRPGWLKGVDDIEQFRIQEAA